MKAILFDAAGTLFRVRGSVGDTYATVARRHGVVVAPAEIEPRFRAAFGAMPPLGFPGVAAAELPQREHEWWRAVVAAVFRGFRFSDFDAFFQDLFLHFARADSWELFPDTQPALTGLRARGLRLAIVSNFDGRLVGICDGLGIAGCFDGIVMSGRVGCAKPDPKIFAIALDRLGVAAAEAVHVGDSDSEDVRGAEAAGLRGVLIARASPGGGPRAAIHDLRELYTHLRLA